MWDIIVKILIAIVALVVITTFIAPLLTGLMPPFGVIILIVLYLAVLAWLMSGTNWKWPGA